MVELMSTLLAVGLTVFIIIGVGCIVWLVDILLGLK